MYTFIKSLVCIFCLIVNFSAHAGEVNSSLYTKLFENLYIELNKYEQSLEIDDFFQIEEDEYNNLSEELKYKSFKSRYLQALANSAIPAIYPTRPFPISPKITYLNQSLFTYPLMLAGSDCEENCIEKFYEDYRWLANLINDAQSMNPIALNKWVEPIKVSFQLPNDMKSFSRNASQRLLELPYDDTFSQDAESEKLIAQIGLELEKFTGIPVTYLSNDKEHAHNIGNLRIIIVNDLPSESRGQNGTKYFDSTKKYSFYDDIEPYFVPAIYFDTVYKGILEGYFISNNKNEIIYSACYLKKDQFTSEHIAECLYKSMGLPLNFVYEGKALPSSICSQTEKSNDIDSCSITSYSSLSLSILYNPELKTGASHKELYQFFNKLI